MRSGSSGAAKFKALGLPYYTYYPTVSEGGQYPRSRVQGLGGHCSL